MREINAVAINMKANDNQQKLLLRHLPSLAQNV